MTEDQGKVEIFHDSMGNTWVEARMNLPDFIQGEAKGTAKQVNGKVYRLLLKGTGVNLKNYYYADDPKKIGRFRLEWISFPSQQLGDFEIVPIKQER